MCHESRLRRSILIALSVLLACDQQSSDQTPAQDSTASSPAPATRVDSAFPTSIDRAILMGPWSPDGESFALAIEETVILYEFDMKEHPYSLRGDTIIVDFQDPTLGVQKKLVLKLTADSLVMKDVEYGVSDTLVRVKQ